MKSPMNSIAERFKDLTLDKKPVEVHDWFDLDSEHVKELINVLKQIDPSYNINVRSWSQLKSKMPLLNEYIEKHCLIGEYLQEQFICQDADCEFCQVKIGRNIRTPETLDGVLRAKVLAPMLRPVTDPSDSNHYLKPEETRKAIVDKKLTVKDLEKEMGNREVVLAVKLEVGVLLNP